MPIQIVNEVTGKVEREYDTMEPRQLVRADALDLHDQRGSAMMIVWEAGSEDSDFEYIPDILADTLADQF